MLERVAKVISENLREMIVSPSSSSTH
ncbi:MAG: hypothetical protein ACR2GU_07790 [Rubrobacteraceae bacterium]